VTRRRAGLGVLVWPALLVALALISLPFIWVFRLANGGSIAGSDDSGGSESEEAHDAGGSESTRAE
jgi:hypothetical protein